MSGREREGKGLGKRRRKALRIRGVATPVVRRLARRAGVKRVASLVGEETPRAFCVSTVVGDEVSYVEYARLGAALGNLRISQPGEAASRPVTETTAERLAAWQSDSTDHLAAWQNDRANLLAAGQSDRRDSSASDCCVSMECRFDSLVLGSTEPANRHTAGD
ncbi:unnamed protein product [Darwinula stevensoni]|uniref:Histone H4 n=1 Tax=Darwinula stevensoni TaxID=69355 RepID=A0A7R8XEF1_9CRUS|nr:unnamed protein product [Darwinula stevensoni]CAG0890557.1 unnamed protein product [Darwinula stevensoni]